LVVAIISVIVIIQKVYNPYSKVTLQNTFLSSIVALLNSTTSLPSALAYLAYLTLSFFFFMAFQYMFAKGFRGIGTLVEQCYTTLLYYAPYTMISTLFTAFITIFPLSGQPFLTLTIRVGISLIFLIISLIINIPALMGIHRITR